MATAIGGLCRLGLGLLCTLACAAARSEEIPPPAYQLAARQAGIPAAALYAIALQESGTRLGDRLVPWPWTLNVAGRAERYATQAEASEGLLAALRRTSATRVDAGLGQVNAGYQAHRYVHPCELLDPYQNLAIAAQILREQHAPGAAWLTTLGRYHRPAGGKPAARYRRSIQQHLNRVAGGQVLLATLTSVHP